MAKSATYDDLLSVLITELGKQTPISQEEREYLDALNVWTKKAEQLTNRNNGTKLTQLQIEKLLKEHNAARPRRKPGRPKSTLPPTRVIEEQLTQLLIDVAVRSLPANHLELLRTLAKRILQETTTTA